VPATFTAFDAPRAVTVDTARDDLRQNVTAVGTVSFPLDGLQHTLTATRGPDDRLYVSFRDLTNGTKTAPWRVVTASVPAGAAVPDDGTVIIDFNRAVNLPFAFTEFGKPGTGAGERPAARGDGRRAGAGPGHRANCAMSSLVTLVGNPKSGSRTLSAASTLADGLAERFDGARRTIIDLADIADGLLAPWRLSEAAAQAAADVKVADLLVIATPTYKASFTGLLKLFLDVLPAGSPRRWWSH
jgi:hypothetical protein